MVWFFSKTPAAVKVCSCTCLIRTSAILGKSQSHNERKSCFGLPWFLTKILYVITPPKGNLVKSGVCGVGVTIFSSSDLLQLEIVKIDSKKNVKRV